MDGVDLVFYRTFSYFLFPMQNANVDEERKKEEKTLVRLRCVSHHIDKKDKVVSAHINVVSRTALTTNYNF